MYNIWNLGVCCSPEETTSELKVGVVRDEGFAFSALQGRSGRASNCKVCTEQCCQQAANPNEVVEVVKMPLTIAIPVRKGADAFIEKTQPMQGVAHSPPPLLASGPPLETTTTPRPVPFNSPYPQYPQESSLTPPLPPLVPQTVGLENFYGADEADQKREEGDVVADLIREGPQWSNLGAQISQNSENADLLDIDHIDELSLLGEWNAKLPKSRQVREGDVIIAVNGCTGRELIRQIQESSEKGCRVTLHIARRQLGLHIARTLLYT